MCLGKFWSNEAKTSFSIHNGTLHLKLTHNLDQFRPLQQQQQQLQLVIA